MSQLLLPTRCGLSQVDTVHHCDLLTLCSAQPPASVDMILADLPYGTTACSWDEVIPFEPMWAAFKRVMKPRGAIVLTASQPFTSRLIVSNLPMFKHSWVWIKEVGTNFLNSSREPMKEHEDVLVFCSEVANYYPQYIERLDKDQSSSQVGLPLPGFQIDGMESCDEQAS